STLAISFSFSKQCRRPAMAVIRSLTRPAAPHGGSGSANLEKHLTFKVTRVGLRWHHPADTLLCRLLLAVVRSKIRPASATFPQGLEIIFEQGGDGVPSDCAIEGGIGPMECQKT